MEDEDIKLVIAIITGLIVGCVGAAIFIALITFAVEWYLD